ncbi:MAG TPA: hypothetical protein VFI88_02390 [Sphingomicrobium sp.]|nr:hypothetical protein [Sphingomicrobium sp.]
MIGGTLYDGHSAFPHEVSAAFANGRLTLTQDSGWSDSIDASTLRRIDAGADTIRLGRAIRRAGAWCFRPSRRRRSRIGSADPNAMAAGSIGWAFSRR